MKPFSIALCLVLLSATGFSQNADWLPQGSVLYYANIPFGHLGDVEIASLEVTSASSTDSSEIRVFAGACNGCESLRPQDGYLERVGAKVYLIHGSEASRYLLYNFAATTGDTVVHIGGFDADDTPYYNYFVITGQDTIVLFDTIVTRKHIAYPEFSDSLVNMFNGPLIDEIGSISCFYPHIGVCDPHSGPLIGYAHPTKGFHCFEPKYCAHIVLTSDYTPFPKGSTAFYRVSELNDKPIFAVSQSDLVTLGDTVLFYPNFSITDSIDYLSPDPFDCYGGHSGWMFDHMRLLPDGEAIFYTGNALQSAENPVGNAFHLRTQAGLNDTWLAMSSFFPNGLDFEIYATVSEIMEMEVLGRQDSVKRIVLSSAQTDAFDDLAILISRNHGIVQAINFSQINNPDNMSPNTYDRQGNYQLVGIEGNPRGVHNLRWLQVWNFAPGDILHTHQLNVSAGSTLDTTVIDVIWHILEADHDHGSESVTYTIDQQERRMAGPGLSSVTLSHDTIVETYANDHQAFDLPPGTAHYDGRYGYHQQGIFNDRNVKCMDEGLTFLLSQADCYREAVVDGCFDCVKYIEGLGGEYFDCFGFGYRSFRGLQYYKKGMEEWGAPFDFSVGTKEILSSQAIYAYPNPATERFQIRASDGIFSRARLFDMTGRLHREVHLDSERWIDVTGLPPGMYFIEYLQEAIPVGTEKIILQN